MTTDPTPTNEPAESARELLYRHGLPEDVVDGALCLHAQELAAVQRREAAVWGVDTAAGKHILGAADLIDPTRAAAVPVPPPTRTGCREQLLDALDFAYCQGLGYLSPTALLDAYDAERATPGPPPADQTALRDRIAEALYAHNHPGWATRYSDLDQDERDTYLARADAVLAVLPEQTDRAAVLREAAAVADGFGQPRVADFLRGMAEQPELRRVAAECAHGPERHGVEAGCIECRCNSTTGHAAAERPAVGEQPETQETRPCDGCGHPAHPSRECPFVRYGERCACDEPVAAP